MPWNDNQGGGQGPWGSGGGNNNGQNPWGQRPNGGGGGGGDQPPDLDEVVRQMQDSLGRMFGGKGGGAGGDGKKGGGVFSFGLIVLVLIGVWFASSGWYQVGPNENGVVLRFGEYSRTTQPGLHFKLPSPLETVMLPEVTTTQSMTIGTGPEGQMLTRDENIVDINFAVQWRVDLSYADGVRDYLFNVRDPEGTVRAVSESAMREVIGTSDLQFIITDGRGEVSRSTRELVQETLTEYQAGIQILQINLQTAQPPADVIDAFRAVDAAEQEADQAVNEATAYSNSVIPVAQGNAARLLQEAQAYRDSVIAEAQGDADRFTALYEEYARAPDVTRQRMYLETMEQVLERSDLLLLDGEAGALPYLPLDRLGQNRTRGGNQ
ncbi:MAG: FtsH protease activity modulator HflK [Maricaulis sp.]|uniref:FtsH protease activity modulator HflK n=1 Tax=Maricaulis sp. TaxID=1486257 RepID=UPI001B031D11|nr:FtsH protease activity modulator HflK [Maricaulis sp.]MBO6729738.1 FtsH protease activity modulator HflK [Maricaulis sp.]MBO6847185.1 FtsH protease activity modulator HflK [Maricaulis sp.]MBO6876843.1 FtsH protease activity modulator HflK [Maricaulis sp.]